MLIEFIITAVIVEKIILVGVVYNIYISDRAQNTSVLVSRIKSLPYDTCPICLEKFNDADKVNVLECNHCFHSKCITDWKNYKTLDKNYNKIEKGCPICRQKIKFKSKKKAIHI